MTMLTQPNSSRGKDKTMTLVTITAGGRTFRIESEHGFSLSVDDVGADDVGAAIPSNRHHKGSNYWKDRSAARLAARRNVNAFNIAEIKSMGGKPPDPAVYGISGTPEAPGNTITIGGHTFNIDRELFA